MIHRWAPGIEDVIDTRPGQQGVAPGFGTGYLGGFMRGEGAQVGAYRQG
jgi:hypothetical protein